MQDNSLNATARFCAATREVSGHNVGLFFIRASTTATPDNLSPFTKTGIKEDGKTAIRLAWSNLRGYSHVVILRCAKLGISPRCGAHYGLGRFRCNSSIPVATVKVAAFLLVSPLDNRFCQE